MRFFEKFCTRECVKMGIIEIYEKVNPSMMDGS